MQYGGRTWADLVLRGITFPPTPFPFYKMLLYKTVSDQKEEFAETKEKNAAEQEALQAVADERFKTQLGEVVSCTWVSFLFLFYHTPIL